jgi:uncharacterized protein (DUF885 family)
VTLSEGTAGTQEVDAAIAATAEHQEIAPEPSTEADQQFDALVNGRFDSLVERNPVLGTFLGLTEHDGRLSDGSRDNVLAEIDEAHRFASALEAIDANDLSPYYAFERELAFYTTRRQIFDDEVHRVWERRVSAADEVGDGIFLVFSRANRPIEERLSAIASRLEAAPQHIEQQKSRLDSQPPVRLWNELELESATTLPSLFDEIVAAARSELPDGKAEIARLEHASRAAARALDEYTSWLKERLAGATDEFALGRERYDELVRLRAFDDLDTDGILAVGEEQLARNREGRARAASEVDPAASVAEVVDRIKSDHPSDFAAALAGYRSAMAAARQFVIDHEIASLPDGETLEVIETPEYMRAVLPFAAYYQPPKFGEGSLHGLYLVTPSVDGSARALREHNYASLYNTSIHEAYPGHHQQLAISIRHPSVVRTLVDAPEFVEGWAMYCEQMMREEGFDTDPRHVVMMYTDAIWRACRIILDIKLQRREINVNEAVDFLVAQTGFERPNAASEVHWYTYRPTYPMSYLLGKVLLLRLRDDEKRRLGARFSLRRFHDALLREGSLPISFHRRLLTRGLDGGL